MLALWHLCGGLSRFRLAISRLVDAGQLVVPTDAKRIGPVVNGVTAKRADAAIW
jgi:hypothetical protein